jgi:hypothetical protein
MHAHPLSANRRVSLSHLQLLSPPELHVAGAATNFNHDGRHLVNLQTTSFIAKPGMAYPETITFKSTQPSRSGDL